MPAPACVKWLSETLALTNAAVSTLRSKKQSGLSASLLAVISEFVTVAVIPLMSASGEKTKAAVVSSTVEVMSKLSHVTGPSGSRYSTP